DAWWPESYTNNAFNPFAVYVYDGDAPEDRKIYLGGRDGYIRRVALDGGDDDGYDISSYVLLGPIRTPDFGNLIHQQVLATLGDSSGSVRLDFYHGRHAEEAYTAALAGPSSINYTLSAGRNRAMPTDREGFAFYIKLSSTDYWTMEKLSQMFK